MAGIVSGYQCDASMHALSAVNSVGLVTKACGPVRIEDEIQWSMQVGMREGEEWLWVEGPILCRVGLIIPNQCLRLYSNLLQMQLTIRRHVRVEVAQDGVRSEFGPLITEASAIDKIWDMKRLGINTIKPIVRCHINEHKTNTAAGVRSGVLFDANL